MDRWQISYEKMLHRHVIRGSQVKATRYTTHSIGVAKTQNPDDVECQQGCEWQEGRETGWQLLTKPKTLLPHGPATALLSTKQQSWKLMSQTYTPMFIATFFIIIKPWLQSRCPSISQGINCGPCTQWDHSSCNKHSSVTSGSRMSSIVNKCRESPFDWQVHF